MTPDGAGHPFQMANDTEIDAAHDWMALSSWNSTRTSVRMPGDTSTGTGSEGNLGLKEEGYCWTVRAPTNTRAIGNLVMVELRKGHSGGLGFSITTRDNLEGPNSPIYIKHILPDGAAIKDGRLRPGDRLLQVNDVTMTGKCLSDVTAILRNIEINELTHIVVSRQMATQSETKASPEIVSNEGDIPEDVGLKEDVLVTPYSSSESSSSVSLPRINCDDRMETLWLRVAHGGSAGSNQLGLRVKRSRRQNLSGLRVRSVIAGGLADKDGQLRANDYLIEVNGISLADVDRPNAIDIFHSALERSAEQLRAIDVTVIRWKLPEISPLVKLENSEFPTLNTIAEEVVCDKRIIPFSNITQEAGVVEGFSVDRLELVDRDVVFSSGRHSCDFFPEDNVLPKVDGQTPHFREIEVCTGVIKCRSHGDNSASAASTLESSDAVVQEKEDLYIDLKVVCFERQGFGRRSISEKRSSRELLSDSEVYRSIKENRKRKDHMKPEEINAGFHEATNLVRERLDLRDQLQVFEPTILESDPQVSIPYDPLGPFPGASTTLGIVSDMSYALGLLPVESNQQKALPIQSKAHPVQCNPLESVQLGNTPTRSIRHGSAPHASDRQRRSTQNEAPSLESIAQITPEFVSCRSVPLEPVLHSSVPPGSVPPGSVPPGSVPPRSVPPRSVPPRSAAQLSIRHGSVSKESDTNGSFSPGYFPVGSVPFESLPHTSVSPVSRESLSGKSFPRESFPRGFIPSGSVHQEAVPLGSTPDVLMNACISNDLHKEQPTDVPTAAAVIRQNDSVVHSNSSSSSTSSQIPPETVSAKPSKKFTATLIRKFFKKGFADLFGSEKQIGINRQFDKDSSDGIIKHLTSNNTPIRKDFSLPRPRSGRIDNDVISSSRSHPNLQQGYPNALPTVPPNFYNPEQFLVHHPIGFRAPLPPSRNTLPVQFLRPNPYPFSTVIVRPHVPAIPTGFAICPTYVPRQQPAAIPACLIRGDRFLSPAQLSWVGFGQKFVNVQRIASQEPRMTNQ